MREQALAAKAWPFEEARKLLARIEAPRKRPESRSNGVLFETGYGPSGLPHIGTFGEVARTSWVRHAFETMSDIPDPSDRLFRRHGWLAQSARQSAATRRCWRPIWASR